MSDEATVGVYWYSDSGPYGWYTEAERGQRTAMDGFGTTDVAQVPASVWETYRAARRTADEAEEALDVAVEAALAATRASAP